MRPTRTCVALALAAAAAALAPPAGAAPPGAGRALIAVLPSSGAALAADPGIAALGLLGANVGDYDAQQALLDLTQGARVAAAVYSPPAAAAIHVDRAGRVRSWTAVRARAGRASAEIDPGLLAAAVPGGAAYVAGGSRPGPEAVIAADRGGRIAAVSLGSAGSLGARAAALLLRFRLVVVAVPDRRQLDRLLAARAPDELVLALERPPPSRPGARLPPRLLALGATGLAGGGGTLASPTTRRPGLVTGIDVAPTVLRWLGASVPAGVQGQAITRTGRRDAGALARLAARLGVISGRRWPAVGAFLLGWLGLLGAAAALAARRPGAVRTAARLGCLTALWTPCTVLAAAGLRPAAPVELAVILGGGFGLALLTDRLLPWPRGPAAPGVAMVLAYAVDLGLGSPLIATSLLGPNPIAGSRFFGIGNELEAALPIVLFAGLAAALPQRPAGRRTIAVFAAAGLCFTGLVASGRLGADVGAIFTIGGGTAAGALALGGRPSRRALALACAAPLLGLAALAGLDLATGAGGHFTRTVLHAGSAGDLADTLRRKLAAALRQLRHGWMPVDTVVCLAAAAYVVCARERVFAPVATAAGWRACFVGGFAGGVLGSLTNDSGPQLLVIATFGLGCVLAYVHGRPGGGGVGVGDGDEDGGAASYPPLQRT